MFLYLDQYTLEVHISTFVHREILIVIVREMNLLIRISDMRSFE